MAEPEDLVAAVLWVAERLHDPAHKIPATVRGLRRAMWNLARHDDKEFYSFLKKALEYRKKEQVAVKDATQAQELEEADIEWLEGRLEGFMEGRRRIFCEKCWRELEESGELGPVTVVHDKGAST